MAYGSKMENPDSFFRSFKHLSVLGQIFGLFPVDGITGANHKYLAFRWKSWKVFYSTFFLFLFMLMLLFKIHICVLDDFSLNAIGGVLFYANAVAANLMFTNLARHWSRICATWAEIEEELADFGYNRKITRRIQIHSIIFMLMAIGEHVLYRLQPVQKVKQCFKEEINYSVLLKFFAIENEPRFFFQVPYHPLIGISIIILSSYSTFTWSFTNLFVAVVCYHLSSRFKQMNNKLIILRGKILPMIFWRKLRQNYDSLSHLTKRLDKHLQGLLVLALCVNLWYICVQLLFGLKSKQNLLQSIYFYCSLGFVIYRTCLLTICAADINDQSKQPLTMLYSVPADSYCLEIRRFQDQVVNDNVALTGCRFFTITRSLLLTIAGSIVTYEIVLVQLHSEDSEPSEHDWTVLTNISACHTFSQ